MRTAITAALTAFLISGCGNAGEVLMEEHMENSMEKEGMHNVDVDMRGEDSIRMESDEGTLHMGKGVPDGWPEDVPLFPGATVEGSMFGTTHDTGDTGGILTMKTDKSIADVMAFYGSLKNSGWKQMMSMDMNGSSLLGLEKGDLTLTVIVAEDEGKTSVSLTVGTTRE